MLRVVGFILLLLGAAAAYWATREAEVAPPNDAAPAAPRSDTAPTDILVAPVKRTAFVDPPSEAVAEIETAWRASLLVQGRFIDSLGNPVPLVRCSVNVRFSGDPHPELRLPNAIGQDGRFAVSIAGDGRASASDAVVEEVVLDVGSGADPNSERRTIVARPDASRRVDFGDVVVPDSRWARIRVVDDRGQVLADPEIYRPVGAWPRAYRDKAELLADGDAFVLPIEPADRFFVVQSAGHESVTIDVDRAVAVRRGAAFEGGCEVALARAGRLFVTFADTARVPRRITLSLDPSTPGGESEVRKIGRLESVVFDRLRPEEAYRLRCLGANGTPYADLPIAPLLAGESRHLVVRSTKLFEVSGSVTSNDGGPLARVSSARLCEPGSAFSFDPDQDLTIVHERFWLPHVLPGRYDLRVIASGVEFVHQVTIIDAAVVVDFPAPALREVRLRIVGLSDEMISRVEVSALLAEDRPVVVARSELLGGGSRALREFSVVVPVGETVRFRAAFGAAAVFADAGPEVHAVELEAPPAGLVRIEVAPPLRARRGFVVSFRREGEVGPSARGDVLPGAAEVCVVAVGVGRWTVEAEEWRDLFPTGRRCSLVVDVGHDVVFTTVLHPE